MATTRLPLIEQYRIRRGARASLTFALANYADELASSHLGCRQAEKSNHPFGWFDFWQGYLCSFITNEFEKFAEIATQIRRLKRI